MSSEQMQRILLVVVAVGLVPIGLFYGLAPHRSLPWALDVEFTGIAMLNILRAIMGLYLALAAFWVVGATRPTMREPAMWSLVVFMLGVGLGRLSSLLADGWPHPALLGAMLLEFAIAGIGWRLLQARSAR